MLFVFLFQDVSAQFNVIKVLSLTPLLDFHFNDVCHCIISFVSVSN